MPLSSFTVSDTILQSDLNVLRRGIFQHTTCKQAPALNVRPLSVMKYDEQGHVVAGLTGEVYWDWLYIDYLWVEPNMRLKGIGRSLVEAAEKEAVSRGCVGVYLWTHEIFAPWLYRKMGYKEFVQIKDFPVGHQRIGFMKRLGDGVCD